MALFIMSLKNEDGDGVYYQLGDDDEDGDDDDDLVRPPLVRNLGLLGPPVELPAWTCCVTFKN